MTEPTIELQYKQQKFTVPRYSIEQYANYLSHTIVDCHMNLLYHGNMIAVTEFIQWYNDQKEYEPIILDFNQAPMKGDNLMPYLKTKLKNQICKRLPEKDLKFKLSNISVNKEKRGCSGHITYLPTGRCVYVNTEPISTNPDKLIYRYAKDDTDYSSNSSDFKAINQFTTSDALVQDIAYALTCPRNKIRTILHDSSYPRLTDLTGFDFYGHNRQEAYENYRKFEKESHPQNFQPLTFGEFYFELDKGYGQSNHKEIARLYEQSDDSIWYDVEYGK